MFVVCPGARSSTLAAALDGGADVAWHYDERGGAFFALGAAKASGHPSVVVTTSGSAVANLHPATVEALHSEIPLLLLTADRPPELLGTGANQTIDQRGIFGPSVRWWGSLPCPDDGLEWEAARAMVQTAWKASMLGPVQINCPFREPLVGLRSAGPLLVQALEAPTTEEDMKVEVPGVERGLLVVGQLSPKEQAGAESIRAWARRAGWPVFADALSGVAPGGPVIAHPDFLLGTGSWPAPQAVVHLGGAVVSKRIASCVAQAPPSACIHIARSRIHRDPLLRGIRQAWCDPIGFCSGEAPPTAAESWLPEWEKAGNRAMAHLDRALADEAEINEPQVARTVAKALPEGAALMIGNSMPIRDFDTFARWRGGGRRIFGSRGASGIDGNIATAAGIARTSGRPMLLLLGDLAYLHDQSSLPLAARERLVIVVVNNGGGGIFHFLPLPVPSLNPLWETPQQVDLLAVAAAHGIRTATAGTTRELAENLGRAFESQEATVIEVRVPIDANPLVHRRLRESFA
jgi:2-succinyl-5-enolpyruvyl-6-hydroxy-3-cyclohexene-1-carboxylate synthase